jgi:hypothetical protein
MFLMQDMSLWFAQKFQFQTNQQKHSLLLYCNSYIEILLNYYNYMSLMQGMNLNRLQLLDFEM